MAGQLSLFSAAYAEPAVDDLAGLLCGPGQLVRRGPSARVSVLVSSDWRAQALLAELSERGLRAEAVPTDADPTDADPTDVDSTDPTRTEPSPTEPVQGWLSVRTAFEPALLGLAEAWSGSGSGKRPPAGLALDGRSLRLWALAAGRGVDTGPALGYALGLGEHDEDCWSAIGAALARAGLAAVFVGPRGDGPAYRLVGQRRTGRLAELVGEAPPGAPASAWPG